MVEFRHPNDSAMSLENNYPKLAGVTATDRQYATNTSNKSYSTRIQGDTDTPQVVFQVGQTVIDNWSEIQDACWFMGAGVGKYDVLLCQLGGIYRESASTSLVTTLGVASYRIKAGLIERAAMKLYDDHIETFFGSNTYIADYSSVYSINYSNTYLADY